MRRKYSYIAITALILAALACSGPGAATTPDATATFSAALTAAFGTAQANVPPVASATPGGAATLPPTPTQFVAEATQLKPSDTPAPSNTPGTQGCSDGAQYVTDVTIPDNTVLQPGQAFTKTWRLKNSGTCAWTGSYQFAFVSGSQMGAAAAVPISGEVTANSLYDVSVNMVAPATPGTYKGNWQMKNSAGQLFGSVPFVQIVVPAPTATNTPITPTTTATATLPPAVALGASATDYGGNWFNNDPATGGITQISVSAVNSTQANVHVWGRCHPTDCDWGTGSGTVAGFSITINNFPGAPGKTVVLSMASSTNMQALTDSFTYNFHTGPVANDWVGTWTNANAGTNNITKIIITVAGNQVSIHPYGKCSPSDCDWGTKNFNYSNPINTGSEFPHNLIITFNRANEMTVQDTTVSITDQFRR